MPTKDYPWESGATLGAHSKAKHQILRTYFLKYLKIKCGNPNQRVFRIAIVDGFAGGGRYKCGSPGSPIIFIETLQAALRELNEHRAAQGLRNALQFDCYLLLNDENTAAIEELRNNCSPLISAARQNENIELKVELLNRKFDEIYPEIRKILISRRYKSIFFNLDQCGYNAVSFSNIKNILATFSSSEVLLTFMIQPFLNYLNVQERKNTAVQDVFDIDGFFDILDVETISKTEFLGIAEKVVYSALKHISPFFSPFSINNPDGWRYWLIHFANHYRARQAYNDVLHEVSNAQVHFGRAGLRMLSYDPIFDSGSLYLFGNMERQSALDQLLADIPKAVSSMNGQASISDLYASVYNETPAHSDDINRALVENPELTVLTGTGGVRRVGAQIKTTDIVKLKSQLILPFGPMR